ncbi:hypothetical protein BCR42DRAFT_406694 [Absidia repens]|uniref:Uncharacterized protein n=1 Tax=Absidia repens TaxID=90262 RepID=A0A1X2IV09_9FUNG|nr:hypothetical protein BCR42DRAFT_406694 [Absidia repens]
MIVYLNMRAILYIIKLSLLYLMYGVYCYFYGVPYKPFGAKLASCFKQKYIEYHEQKATNPFQIHNR